MSKKRKPTIRPIKIKRKWDDDKSRLVFRSAHMVSLLTLLNRGWSRDDLKQFNDEFNVVLLDVCSGYLSFSDIIDTINEETGLTLEYLEWG